MITLVFMTDKKRVIGGSTLLRNLIRMPFLPIKELTPAMASAMKGDYMVMGSQSSAFYAAKAPQYKEAFVLSRDRNYKPKNPSLQVCNDVESLINRFFKHSPDELLVVGGLSAWKMFLPHSDKIIAVETHRNVPGDLLFDAWDKGEFTLSKQQVGKKLSVLEYTRKLQA